MNGFADIPPAGMPDGAGSGVADGAAGGNYSGFGTIIEIGDVLVSEDVVCEFFACDYEACGGVCCIEGDSGAPLEEDELEGLEEGYPEYSPLMSSAGRDRIAEVGFFELDRDGDLVTPCLSPSQPSQVGSWAPPSYGAEGGTPLGGGSLPSARLSGESASQPSCPARPGIPSGACAFCHFPRLASCTPSSAQPPGLAGADAPASPSLPSPPSSSLPASTGNPLPALCAIELAGRPKPRSCALYPIRITKMPGGGLALNLHRWKICEAAYAKGRREGIRAYEFLRGPIERRFGPDFYAALTAAASHLLSC